MGVEERYRRRVVRVVNAILGVLGLLSVCVLIWRAPQLEEHGRGKKWGRSATYYRVLGILSLGGVIVAFTEAILGHPLFR